MSRPVERSSIHCPRAVVWSPLTPESCSMLLSSPASFVANCKQKIYQSVRTDNSCFLLSKKGLMRLVRLK